MQRRFSLFRVYTHRSCYCSSSHEEKALLMKKERKPPNFWADKRNREKFLLSLGERHQLHGVEDWLERGFSIVQKEGRQLLHYGESWFQLLKDLFPKEDWKHFYTTKYVTPAHWNSLHNQKEFYQHVKETENLSNFSGLSSERFIILGGSYLLRKYEDPVEFETYVTTGRSKMERKPKNFWKEKENQIRFLDMVARTYGIADVEGWASITKKQILECGGRGLVNRFNSVSEMLEIVYPDLPWYSVKRKKLANHYWDDKEHIESLRKRIEEKYEVKSPADWYRISADQVKSEGGIGFLRKCNSFSNMVSQMYPQEEWDCEQLDRRDKRSAQRFLFLLVRSLFDHCEVLEDFIHPELTRVTGMAVEFDIYVPEHHLALEYHGEQHFRDLPAFGNLEMYQQRDREKMKLCHQHNITLVVIPHTWDKELFSLKKAIAQQSSGPHPLPI